MVVVVVIFHEKFSRGDVFIGPKCNFSVFLISINIGLTKNVV